MKKLEGKTAIVTGASKGIGAAIAKAYSEEGARVIVNYASDKEGAERVVDAIRESGGEAKAVQANLTKDEDIKRLFSEAHETFGKLDILVNNAGIYEFLPIEKVSTDHFHKQFNLNVLAVALSVQEALRYFTAEGGSIINISSGAATYAGAGASVYSATKAALNTLSISLSRELGARNIRVNVISPGMIETEGFHAAGINGSDFHKEVEAATPLGRIGRPEDIAPVAVFYASEDSGWVSGEVTLVSGGQR